MAAVAAAFVINLERRADRLATFCARYPRDLPTPERFAGVDGQELAPTGIQYRGRWGCWESHLGVLRLCIEREIDSVLIFEDDAWPVPECEQLWPEFLDALPGDWQLVFLGASIQGQARRVNRYVGAFPRAVVLQSYLIRQPLLSELAARAAVQPEGEPHVDNYFADLTAGRPGIYGSIPWLFWHDAGRSDNSGKLYQEPFTWPHAGELTGANWVPRPQPCDAGPDGRCRRDRCRQIGAHRCAVSPGLMHVDEGVVRR